MRINNVEFEYFIDYIAKKIHLLDLDRLRRMDLTNNIDPHFQQKLIDQETLLQDVLDFDWICYGSDGVIYLYEDYNFKFVNENSNFLHKPYIEIAKKRRVR